MAASPASVEPSNAATAPATRHPDIGSVLGEIVDVLAQARAAAEDVRDALPYGPLRAKLNEMAQGLESVGHALANVQSLVECG